MDKFSGKRYNSYNEYFKRTFGQRVQKVSIDAGFTCPNRDGTTGLGGCTYCNNDAFNPSYCQPQKPVSQQIAEGIEFHKVRYRRALKYLAYFQTYSNTYCSINRLKELYEQALAYPEITGLVIGTRPDCIDDEKLAYLADIARHHYVIVEYGMESTNNETLKLINRGHTFEQTAEAISKTASYGLKTGAHLIFGLPGESRQQMLEQAHIVSALPLTTIKFHQLQIVKDTVMAKQFLDNPSQFKLFSLDEYIDFIVAFIERLNPDIVIERFTGEVPPRFLVNKAWGQLRADQVALKIEQEMERLNTWQGKKFIAG
ncbi:MAG: TIGR01212 family radical SAM protein [Lentimicrobiaceae bacterium]|nr:TIGR01212 family radical SAM protein [Lentimicrobiaceae bacterium]MCB9023873.1 TIGR01212 family radical SAM protein [Lentimicrobiaceae bacterium]MCO5266218.1 TIGR01212 family radical SAM protein [Lentimicrobium sp.]